MTRGEKCQHIVCNRDSSIKSNPIKQIEEDRMINAMKTSQKIILNLKDIALLYKLYKFLYKIYIILYYMSTSENINNINDLFEDVKDPFFIIMPGPVENYSELFEKVKNIFLMVL